MDARTTLHASDPREQLGAFAAYLREHGFALGFAEVGAMLDVAARVPGAQWLRVGGLWRAIAAGSREQWRRYPDLHDAFWFPGRMRGSVRTSGVTRRARMLPEIVEQLHSAGESRPPGTGAALAGRAMAEAESVAPSLPSDNDPQRAQGGASRVEALHERDLAAWQAGDIDHFEPLVEEVRRRLREQLLRRWRRSQGDGVIHLRRSLRTALTTGGEVIQLVRVRRRRRLPRLVLLVDVSRSIEMHAQFFLRLARAFVEGLQARAFVFHTRLAEVTPLLRGRSARVQEKINAVTFGFGGGTRIASCLRAALDVHIGRALGRGDLFMVFSDGYDTDPPRMLADALSAVRLRGARVFWLHPTRDPAQSLALQAAAPFVEAFVAAHDLASLRRLPERIAGAIFGDPQWDAC